MDSTQQSNLPKKAAKSIFQSKTFWGATLTAVAAIAPIIGEAVEAKKFTVNDTVKVVVLLATTGATLVGRVQAESEVYTPNLAPGPNESDFESTNS